MSFPSSVELPDHWSVMALKRFCDVRDGTHETPAYVDQTDDAYPLLTSKDISDGEIRFDEAKYISAADFVDISKRSNVERGDIVMPMIGSVGGAVSVETDRPFGIKNIALFKKSEGFCSRWLQLLIDSDLTKYQFDLMQSGGVQGFVSLTTLRNLVMPFPPLDEQKAISSFLDVETSKIDGLVSEQRRLIELLKEKRQAVISHAVTKGLNPNAPMKPSGIQWLGDVPQHWEIKRLSRVGRLQNGLNIGGDAFGSGDPFVSYGDVYKNANVPEMPSGLVQSTQDDQVKCSLEVGDVLFTRTSETVDDIGVASTCLCSMPRSTFAGFLIRLRPNAGILDPQYSTYLFRNQGVQGHFSGTMNMVTRASLSQDVLKMLPICIPPINEQGEIAAFIQEKVELFRGLIAEAKRAIELLQERRTALISAAVTGKIDVRDVLETAAP